MNMDILQMFVMVWWWTKTRMRKLAGKKKNPNAFSSGLFALVLLYFTWEHLKTDRTSINYTNELMKKVMSERLQKLKLSRTVQLKNKFHKTALCNVTESNMIYLACNFKILNLVSWTE